MAAIVIIFALITAFVIIEARWVYYVLLFVPLLICISVISPFIFPFGLYVFLLPFDALLSMTGGTTGATLTKLLGILTILTLLSKGFVEGKLKKPEAASLWYGLFVVYGALSVCWAIEPEAVMSRLPSIIGLFFVYFVVVSYEIARKEYVTLKWIIFIGGIAVAFFTIYAYHNGYFYTNSLRATVMTNDRVINPNLIAFNFLFPISIGFSLLLNENKKPVKLIFLLILSVIIYAVTITGSRGGMVAVGAVIIVHLLSLKGKVIPGIIIISIAILALSSTQDTVFERWSTAIETGGSGRLNIWHVGLQSLEKYWLNGAGLANFSNAYNKYVDFAEGFSGFNRGAHNMILMYSVELGIIGVTLLFVALWKHYQSIQLKADTYYPDVIMLKAVFWGIMVGAFFLSINLMNKSFWLLWMMIMMHRGLYRGVMNVQLGSRVR